MKKDKIFIGLIGMFSSNDILALERIDRQYIALQGLYSHIKDSELFLRLVVTNALLSYQLSTKGEIYWENFAKFFSRYREIDAFPHFLKTYNKRLLDTKLKRYKKISACIEDMNLSNYCEKLSQFTQDISHCLNQKQDAKTIVFSAKMLLYGCRIVKKKKLFAPDDIFIPLDNRIKKIEEGKRFWREISEKTRIPLLHIDSIIWITMGLGEENIKKLDPKLSKKVNKLKIFLNNML